MSKSFRGELEIDEERGVIYFHCSDERDVEKLGLVTMLRIQGLTNLKAGQFVDIRVPQRLSPEDEKRLNAGVYG